MHERRRHLRHEQIFPLQIDTDHKKDRIGVVRNASPSGILFGTPSHFRVGDRVTLRLLLDPSEPLRHTITGRIVRLGTDSAGDWFARLVAVSFDEEVPLLAGSTDAA
jgi:hypothetical protein